MGSMYWKDFWLGFFVGLAFVGLAFMVYVVVCATLHGTGVSSVGGAFLN